MGIVFLILHCLNSLKKIYCPWDQIHWDPLRVKWALLDLAITCWAVGVQFALISLFSLSKIGNASQCQAAHFISSDFELKVSLGWEESSCLIKSASMQSTACKNLDPWSHLHPPTGRSRYARSFVVLEAEVWSYNPRNKLLAIASRWKLLEMDWRVFSWWKMFSASTQ